ncbi:MAG: peptidoglycan editing factor PgeF [Pseudomonadota bacterium]
MPLTSDQLIVPQWPAPDHIQAFTTVRHGGVSDAPYDSLNLGFHVNDRPEHVAQNVQLIQDTIGSDVHLAWMKQVHGVTVCSPKAVESEITEGDAMYTSEERVACSVLSADCLPVLFCDREGNEVGASHAGWRGLAAQILSKTLSHFSAQPRDVLVWLGPAIGPTAFEVGQDVKDAFIASLGAECASSDIDEAFTMCSDGKYFADLYQLARLELRSRGVQAIYGGEHCTLSDFQFYSYRRDQVTGRMASVIVRHSS